MAVLKDVKLSLNGKAGVVTQKTGRWIGALSDALVTGKEKI